LTTTYGAVALAGELDKLARAVKGTRNDTLNGVWFKLAQLAEAGHLDREEAWQRVADVAREIGLPEREIRATMGSADRGGAHKPRRTPPPDPTGNGIGSSRLLFQPGGQAPAVDTGVSHSSSDDQPPTFDHLYLTRPGLADLPQPQPLIDGVLDEHTLFALTGRDRSYKSFIVLDWLACLATGRKWLDHEARQTRVLYVVGEGAYGLDERLRAWETAWSTPIPGEWFHVRKAPVNLFKRAADCAELYERIAREQYGVIVFDTLQRMASGAETNSAKDASVIVSTMAELRGANNTAAIGIVAHTGKTDEDVRGSSAFEDDLDLIWRVRRDEDEQKIVAQLAKRKDGPEGLAVELRPDPVKGTGSIVLVPARGINPRPPEHHLPLLRALAKAGPGGESKTTLQQLLGLSVRKLYAAAEYLEQQSLIERTASGQRRFWRITPSGLSAIEQLDDMERDQR
jgi:predicted transcriptional regulator